MGDEFKIEQKTGMNSKGNNIGIQNNYIGITPEKATEIAINLFMDNFPKLQELAKEIVIKRMDELKNELFGKLAQNPQINYGVFLDPDVQYVLYEAEKTYARYGTAELLDNLSSLLEKRIKHDDKDYLKIILNSAIKVLGQLGQQQIDLLTLTFLVKDTKHNRIKTISDYENFFNRIGEMLNIKSKQGLSLLNSCGCLQFNLGYPEEFAEYAYGLNKEKVKKIMPEALKNVPIDYGTSDIGKAIAIINAQTKKIASFTIENYIK